MRAKVIKRWLQAGGAAISTKAARPRVCYWITNEPLFTQIHTILRQQWQWQWQWHQQKAVAAALQRGPEGGQGGTRAHRIPREPRGPRGIALAKPSRTCQACTFPALPCWCPAAGCHSSRSRAFLFLSRPLPFLPCFLHSSPSCPSHARLRTASHLSSLALPPFNHG
jgi:hypothetical protein